MIDDCHQPRSPRWGHFRLLHASACRVRVGPNQTVTPGPVQARTATGSRRSAGRRPVLSCRSCSGLDEVGLIHRFVLVKLDCGGRAGARVRSHRSSEARPQLPVEDLGGCRVLWRVVASGRRSRSIGAPPRAGLGLWRSRPSGRSVRRRRDGGRRAIEVREARLGEVSTLVNLGQLLGRLSCQPPHEGRLICFTRVSANSRAPSPAPSTMPVATGKRNPRRAASARRTLP